jgi:FixJ family two-component response regulator
LTPREREVLPLVGDGFRNAQIAAELGTSEKTIKVHRGHVMRKMRVESLAHLIHISKQLGLSFRGREGGEARSTPPPRGANKS